MNEHAPPVLERPSDMIAFVDRIAEQQIHAQDPEGNPLTFSKNSGPSYMTVTTIDPGTGLGTGIIRVSPGSNDVGRDTVLVGVHDAYRSDVAWLTLAVFPNDRPVFLPIYDWCVSPGDTLDVPIRAADPDNRPLTFSETGLPPFGYFADNGNGTATLRLIPRSGDLYSGTLMSVTVTNGTFSISRVFGIAVNGCSAFAGGGSGDQPPIADPGGPYHGLVGDPLDLSGTGSSDPEGEALRFEWALGDGAVAVGPSPSHVYERAGEYGIDLLVSDGHSVVRRSTTATIAGAFPARALMPEGQATYRLDTGKPTLCVGIEPVNASYRTSDVDPSTIVMVSPGTGSVAQIVASNSKRNVLEVPSSGGDEVLDACFRREDLRRLFDRIQPGRSTVSVRIEGHLVSGGKFSAPRDLTIVRGKGHLAEAVAPNPLNPQTTVSFWSATPGRVSVLVFDAWGRLVRTLDREEGSPAGYHEIRFDGQGDHGERLASGIYFYRIVTPDGAATGRLVIAR